jgi:hypothetical protein
LQRFKIATLGNEIYCKFAARNREENSNINIKLALGIAETNDHGICQS